MGLGFDADDTLSSDLIFKVHGTQTWGIRDFDNYVGGVQRYRIAVGTYFTGTGMRLVLVNDKDSGALTNSARFSNIRVLQTGGSNQPPMLADPGDQSGTVGAPSTLSLSASDPDGDALTFTASALPPD